MMRRTSHEDVFAVVRVDHAYPDPPNAPPEQDGPSIRFGAYDVTIKEIVRNVATGQVLKVVEPDGKNVAKR